MAPSQTFVLRYTDEDGDLITIDSTPELHEAIALAQSSDKVIFWFLNSFFL